MANLIHFFSCKIRYICQTQGSPPEQMLRTATKITKLFNRDDSGHYPFWRLKVGIHAGVEGLRTTKKKTLLSHILGFQTPEEYEAENNLKSKEARKYIFNCLEDMAHVNVPTDLEGVELIAEKLDRRAFVGILKEMLQLDQERRIEPDTALKDTFLTMNHLVDYAHLNNVRLSFQMMEVSYKKTRMSDSHAAAAAAVSLAASQNALMSNPFMSSSNNNNMTLAFNNSTSVPFNTQVNRVWLLPGTIVLYLLKLLIRNRLRGINPLCQLRSNWGQRGSHTR